MSDLRSHIYDKDSIVIGGDLRSLLFAYSNELPVIYANPHRPFQFDEIKHENLSILGLDDTRPYKQSELWARINFFLGLSGLLPMGDSAANIRVIGNQLSVTTKHTANIKFNFNKLVIIDDDKISGLPTIKKETREKSRVVDWVNVRSGCSHNILHLRSDREFIKEIIFYPTDRSDNRNLKDLVAISYLTDEQLDDFNFSDTMVKFKVTEMMKGAGIRGARNGRDVLNPQRYKYYAVKVEPAQRVVERNEVRHYEDDGRFEFRYDSLEEILDNLNKPSGYLSKISEAF
tara:strand:- start:244 stop:1107 length:864 start_codon:yes stop_codon:yes gene_type:complete